MHVELAVVRRGGALAPARQPRQSTGQLALAALVDEVRRERAHQRGVALAVGANELPLGRVAPSGHGAREVVHEKPAERAPVRSGRKRNESGKPQTRHRHQRDELDTGLAALALHLGLSSSQSREKSIGLAQSLTIWSAPEIGTVWRGRVSGWRSP